MAESETLHSLLDPRSMLLSQFSDSHKPQFLELRTESFIMERGPRFKEYSDLRDKKLREKKRTPERERERELPKKRSPRKQQVKFNSILTHSVPDFSSALRKENRKPLPPVAERSMTPPAGFSKSAKAYGKVSGGSKSTNSAEKRSGGLMTTRKSYANMDELKGLASAARTAITGENRGGVRTSGRSATLLGSRQFY